MAGKVNFSAFIGDSFIKTITFRNKTSGTPVNLTGATITGKVGDVNLTCALVTPASGIFRFSLTNVQTAAFAEGVYDIWVTVTYPDTTVQTIITGNVVFANK